MARVPEGGWPNRDPGGGGTLARFNVDYRSVLQDLEDAWASGTQSILNRAVFTMINRLITLARTLMRIPLESGGDNYGPDFII